MTVPHVQQQRHGPIVTVTLSRPEVRNAQTPAMWEQLRRIGAELPGDVRVVVVQGEGSSFSAGLDLSLIAPSNNGEEGGLAGLLAHLPEQQAHQQIAAFQQAFSWLRRPDLVTIAAVQGHAIGAGLQLALACDLRLVADDAALAMPEVTLGLVPDLGGTKRLVELVGYAHALEICITGRRLRADEAQRIGLANLVVSAADLPAATNDLAAAVLQAPRDAVVEIKALLSAAGGRSYAEQGLAEQQAQVRRIRDLAGLGD